MSLIFNDNNTSTSHLQKVFFVDMCSWYCRVFKETRSHHMPVARIIATRADPPPGRSEPRTPPYHYARARNTFVSIQKTPRRHHSCSRDSCRSEPRRPPPPTASYACPAPQCRHDERRRPLEPYMLNTCSRAHRGGHSDDQSTASKAASLKRPAHGR